ncbi:MAG TPA: TetR/AcrR family transcriptional regulator [Beijerinckiaceae bacterium]|nr:TetR/AcrR family transcriptional regulator [Beijerinckiaceae bacterium]
MERKPPRRTKERILATALDLFNRFGERAVTTSAIAEDMRISPGNLYYHFKSKEMIVEALFGLFRQEIEHMLAAPEKRPSETEDIWLFLHLVFEAIWKYRFIYRDLTDLVSRHRPLEVQFKRILAHKQRTAEAIMHGLVQGGRMHASRADIEALALNMTLIATYWLSFDYVRHPRAPDDGTTLARGAFHVMALAAPYLTPHERALLDHLAQRYKS